MTITPAVNQPTTYAPSLLPNHWTLADLHRALGSIPSERILLQPPPGTATEADLVEATLRGKKLCELEFGTLVEKAMGWYESLLAGLILSVIRNYLETHDLGQVLGADGTLKILPGIVKIPDVCFIGWSRFPEEKLPRTPIPALIPDLAVEVLSEGNTQHEMSTKLEKYFDAGVRLVWYVDSESRTATMWQHLGQPQPVAAAEELDGFDVLPGLRISLTQLFAQADRQSPLADETN
ncbi:MAG: Uma2 family endonuclease [Aureliella sp.]